jgi:hypothetical protein
MSLKGCLIPVDCVGGHSTRNEFQRTTIQLYSEIITQTYQLGHHLGKAGTAARDAASSAGAAVNSATSSVTASAGTGLGLVIKLLGIGVEGIIQIDDHRDKPVWPTL